MPSPIEDYALLGDLQTAALVAKDGSIDWLCVPRFDSPACFAALLDTPEAGRWQLAPAAGGSATRRSYRDDSLVLDSEWHTPDGVVRVVDCMPPRGSAIDVVRVVEGVSGRVPMRMDLRLRFDCWLRDAAFTLQALLGTGFVDEARAWREWLVRAVAGDPGELQIMYGLDGSRRLPEQRLPWLSGYEGSAPVRIGNAAVHQKQLDVWGEVLDGLHLARDAGLPATDVAWDVQRALLDYLEGHWTDPDNGLWEMRGPRRHFVHSKVMAWAGLDRAVHTVTAHGLDGPVDHWRAVRDRIHREVCAHGYDPERNTFTQFYGSRGVDAALLLLPRVGFLPWHDPRVHGTVDAVRKELCENGFVRRYDPYADGGVDGLPGGEGVFLACSFWLADALHGIGRAEQARELFGRLLDLRNDVGLLSEEYDPATGRHLGNTPQAFSMVGLVNTARELTGSSVETSAAHHEQHLGDRAHT
ncbi:MULTISPECIES: glycoside hydrolase family 15 protein [unclassified Nocardia]|uniref:glycoside hydrolase family 15 protein n=1 Tax=unclassified Nocardia TaxID=2637762 RepID=UPI0024A90BF3|nr:MULTISPECIES: glycoside hydrolase family 15 protein [unclassified Nocardia]